MSMLDREGRYLDVNHAWEEFTGRQRADVLGTPAAALQTEAGAELHSRQDRKLLNRGGEVRYESVWTNRDGSPRDLYISKSTFPGPDGKPAGIVVCFMDISEFREAERITRAARDAALEASQAKSEFIANVSHELRTPLQTILGFSEIGEVRARDDTRLAAMFADIHRAGQRMLALVNDLLDLSKIESPVEKLQPRRQDLRPLLLDMAAELRPLLDAKRLRLQVDVPEQELIALIDPPRLAQVLRNLLANAIKFSPEGGLVEMRARLESPQHLLVQVADRGPGIPPAEVEKIFEAFVQSSRTKDGSGGTGLGLAICRRIVDAHGGRISAANRPDGGAVLSFWLPATRFGDTQPAAL
jgi:PAS domain S-box-containing protein